MYPEQPENIIDLVKEVNVDFEHINNSQGLSSNMAEKKSSKKQAAAPKSNTKPAPKKSVKKGKSGK